MTDLSAEVTAPAERPTTGQLFRGFLHLGLTGFGGVLPMTRHMLVDEKRWLSAAEFTDLLGLCQFLPGGNVINLSVAVGTRFRGPLGGAAALFGLILAPSVIVLLLGIVYARYQDNPHVLHLVAGVAAAAAGLLVAMSLKMLLPLRTKPLALVLALGCFAAIALLRWPLLPVMLVLAPLSILLHGALRK